MEKTGKRLVCNAILIQEFYDLPKRLWPSYNVGEYGGFKCTDVKKSATGEITGLAYFDKFLLYEKNYKKMVKRLKKIRDIYRVFYNQQPQGAKLVWQKLPELKKFKKQYGEFWREIVVEVMQKYPGNYFRRTALFNVGKLGSSSDRKTLSSFIDLVLNILDIDTFPGVRITGKRKKQHEYILKQHRAKKSPKQIMENFPLNLHSDPEDPDETGPSYPTIHRVIKNSK